MWERVGRREWVEERPFRAAKARPCDRALAPGLFLLRSGLPPPASPSSARERPTPAPGSPDPTAPPASCPASSPRAAMAAASASGCAPSNAHTAHTSTATSPVCPAHIRRCAAAVRPPPAPPATPSSSASGNRSGSARIVARIHHLRQIHRRMPRHGKRQLRLPRMHSLNAGQHQRSHVQHRRQRPQPRLIAVLRAKETQHRIRNLTLQQIPRPALPVSQHFIQNSLVHARVLRPSRQPHQQLHRRRRRPCPRIQHGNLNLPP